MVRKEKERAVMCLWLPKERDRFGGECKESRGECGEAVGLS